MAHDLLLLSNSALHGRAYLEHALGAVSEFLGGRRRVAFAPFALADHEAYTAKVAGALAPLGARVVGLHGVADPVADAEVLFVGGGTSDADPSSTHMGETRGEQIAQFLEDNDVPVLGMREKAWLRRRGDRLGLEGDTGALLFRRGAEPAAYDGGADLSFLLELPAHFDIGS